MLPTYHGHTNYPTWCVSLWIDDGQEAHFYWLENARNCVDIYELEQMLKDEIEDSNPLADDASMFSDLMTWALAYVDWNSIASSMFEYAHEGNEEE